MPHPVPRILMSATFTRGDYESVSKIFGMSKPGVLQGPLARRNTKFEFFLGGDPAKSFLKSGTARHKNEPNAADVVLQLQNCLRCESSLLQKAELMIETCWHPSYKRSTIHLFTGGDGLKMKRHR